MFFTPVLCYLFNPKNCRQKPTSKAKTRRLMCLVHTAHRVVVDGNLWDLQVYYATFFAKSQIFVVLYLDF